MRWPRRTLSTGWRQPETANRERGSPSKLAVGQRTKSDSRSAVFRGEEEIFMPLKRTAAMLLNLILISTLGYAQSALLNLPRDSQHAELTQRIGVTDITINYHR